MRILRVTLWALIGVLVLFGAFTVQSIWFKPLSIDIFFERTFIVALWRNPELLTRIGILEGLGYRAHNGRLTDASPARMREDAAYWRSENEVLESYDDAELTAAQRLSKDILKVFLHDQIAGEPFLFHAYLINPTFGEQKELPELIVTQNPVASVA